MSQKRIYLNNTADGTHLVCYLDHIEKCCFCFLLLLPAIASEVLIVIVTTNMFCS